MQLPGRRYKWLFLPLETKVRELDGKLLLAAIAAERGWAVIIGRKNSVAEFTSDIRGIVIDKDGLASKKDRIDQYIICLLYTSPSPRDRQRSRMPSSA